jgi:hypothetical protein
MRSMVCTIQAVCLLGVGVLSGSSRCFCCLVFSVAYN